MPVPCVACGHLRMRGQACTNCGWQPKRRGQGIDYVDDNLVEIGKTECQETDRITFYCELRGHQQTARKKDGSPYHPKWAQCQYKDKFGTWPDWSWNSFAPLEPSDATRRWIKHKIIAWARSRAPA
jgi:hypothetical protein